MAIEILMPALSPTMEEGTLAKWLVGEGDAVRSGDVIAEIETDKATMEVEALDDGTIGKLLVAAGTEAVKVNVPIAMLLEEGESADAIAASTASLSAAPVAAPAAAPAPASVSAPAPAPVVVESVGRDPVAAGSMNEMTVREALRDAMAEEMRADDRVFAAELMIWSIACMAKLKVMNSITGRRSPKAAPTPSPAKPCSVIGVSITRFAPNSASSPWVTL